MTTEEQAKIERQLIPPPIIAALRLIGPYMQDELLTDTPQGNAKALEVTNALIALFKAGEAHGRTALTEELGGNPYDLGDHVEHILRSAVGDSDDN